MILQLKKRKNDEKFITCSNNGLSYDGLFRPQRGYFRKMEKY